MRIGNKKIGNPLATIINSPPMLYLDLALMISNMMFMEDKRKKTIEDIMMINEYLKEILKCVTELVITGSFDVSDLSSLKDVKDVKDVLGLYNFSVIRARKMLQTTLVMMEKI